MLGRANMGRGFRSQCPTEETDFNRTEEERRARVAGWLDACP